ncbi:MAG: hypothetical protein FJY54_10745 [Betaproteobacteria bacterium]|nr:hypothetical protein [Betaproteobacteria bacterium]
MSILIHATVTITGDAAQRGACEARLRRLLSEQFLKNEVTEHHGESALCYDLKVEGGIPFPAFAQASQEFPDLAFSAEWVDVAAGARGRASIANGLVTQQQTERISTHAGSGHPVYVAVAKDGTLELALTLFRAAADEWRGYALTASGDALVRVLRRPGAVELHATEGRPQWSVLWRRVPSSGAFVRDELQPPIEIEGAVFQELDELARRFVADWVWFATDPERDIAIEKERFQRYGYGVRDANVRAARLHLLRSEAQAQSGVLEHDTFSGEDAWAKEVVRATWAAKSES